MAFSDWIHSCALIDLEAAGPHFTWRGPKWEGRERVYKRLDRGLCNIKWQDAFANAVVRVLPRVHSDHHPLLFSLEEQKGRRGTKQFRFEKMWMTHPDFKNFWQQEWKKEE